MLVKYALSLDEKGQNLSTNDRILPERVESRMRFSRVGYCVSVYSLL